MKRTISKMLGIAALAIASIAGSLAITTPAQAAYVAPFVPTGCTKETHASFPYPWQKTSTPTTTGWYIYCGSNPTRFKARAGERLKDITNGTAPANIRDKFQAYNIDLYVFENAAAAQAKLGVAAFPADTQVPGIQGVQQPVAVGNATNAFVAVFERVLQADGITYLEYPNTNALNNFDEVLDHESGHALDTLATTLGSGNSNPNAFRDRILLDIIRFNGRNGCTEGAGPDKTMFNTHGMHKTTICDGFGNYRTTPVNYAAKTNTQIIREFHVETAWRKYFIEGPPGAPTYNEVWAQLIAIRKIGGNTGSSFVELDAWMKEIYKCGRAYTDQLYNNWTVPNTTCAP